MGSFPGSIYGGSISWAYSSGANCQSKVAKTANFVTINYR